MTEIDTGGGHDRTEPVDIRVEMQRSYIAYAMSVIVDRALPDVRDGPSRCTPACCTPCTTAATGRTVGSSSAPASSARSWASTTRTATARSTTRWSDGPAVGDADAAGRRPGQLRLPGQRPARGDALHRVLGWRRWPWRCCGTSTRTPSISGELRRALPQASCCPPGSRTCWSTGPGDRGRDGHQDPAAQPARGRRGRAVIFWIISTRPTTRLLDALISGSRARTSHPRPDRGPPWHRGRVPDRPRLDHHARGGRGRGGRPRAHPAGRHRAALPGQPGERRGQDRRAGPGRPGRRDRRRARRDQRPGPASGW